MVPPAMRGICTYDPILPGSSSLADPILKCDSNRSQGCSVQNAVRRTLALFNPLLTLLPWPWGLCHECLCVTTSAA